MNEATSKKIIPSTCWECSTTCGALLTVEDGKVVKVGPNKAHPASKGAFCAKGVRALQEWTYRKGRLLHPLKRVGSRGSGQWQRISWEQAFGEIAIGFSQAHREHGALSIAGAVSGGYFSRGAIVALLMRAIGSPNWLINQDLCGGCRGVSDRVTGLGITNGEDIDNTKVALVVGRNPYAADPVQWRALLDLKKRGGSIIAIDPNETPVTRRADIWLRPYPSTDAAIALAMMHVIIEQRWFDAAFVAKWCTGFDELARRVRDYSPAVAAQITGVEAQDIVAAARLYAQGPSTFVSGHGIDAFTGGFQTFRAFHCLLAICANVDRAGGNLRLQRPPGFRTYLDLIHAPRFQLPPDVASQTLGAQQFPLWSGPHGWQGACHNPTVLDAILTGRPYPVRAMLVSGVNIAVTYPDPQRTVEALQTLNFVAVAAHELNPTTAWADIVLPKTTTLEEEEIQLQPNGPCVSYTQPAHPPMGEAKDDFAIALGILDKLQELLPVDRAMFPWRTKAAFNQFLVGDSGIDVDKLRQDGFVAFPTQLGQFESQGFATSSGKIELYSQRLADLGQDPLPAFVEPRVRPGGGTIANFPLVLLTGERDKNYHHSRFRDQQWLRDQIPYPILRIHPRTATSLGLANGTWVSIETSDGPASSKAQLEYSERVLPSVVSTGMGWWLPEAAGPDFGNSEVNINNALAYGAPFDPVVGSADSRGLACRLAQTSPP